MKVLIVGGGGREHAIAYCVAKSSKVEKMYDTPEILQKRVMEQAEWKLLPAAINMIANQK